MHTFLLVLSIAKTENIDEVFLNFWDLRKIFGMLEKIEKQVVIRNGCLKDL